MSNIWHDISPDRIQPEVQQQFRVSIVDLQMFPVPLCKVYLGLYLHLYYMLCRMW